MTPKEYAQHFWDLRVYLLRPKGEEFPAAVLNPAVTLLLAEKTVQGLATGVTEAMHSVIQEDHGLWRHVRVASYRLGPSGEDTNKDGAVNWKADAAGVKDKLYSNNLTSSFRGEKKFKVFVRRLDGVFETKLIEKAGDISYAAAAPFSGKGFPEEVQVSLQLRYRYQKSPFTLEQFVSKSFIGLDCNGFVGGYLRRRDDLTGWHRTTAGFGPSTTIRELLNPQSTWFSKLADFQPPGARSLVLGMCNAAGTVLDNDGAGNYGHIMISEPNTMKNEGGKIVFEAVESTGGAGLVASQYRVEAMPKPGVFQIHRGSKGDKMLVRVRPLD